MKRIVLSLMLVVFGITGVELSSVGMLNAQGKTGPEFFAKNTVTLVVPVSPGGGTDYAGRVIAEFWPKFTGGHMIVKNMPGANGLLGVNHVYTAKPDGLTIGLAEAAQTTPAWVFRLSGVQYDIPKMNWFSLIAPVPYALVISSKSAAKSLQDIGQMDKFRMGSCDVTGTDTLAMVLIAEAFKLKNAKIISGFPGTTEIGLSIARGELEGAAYHPVPVIDWTTKGYIKASPLVTVWPERVYLWADTPTIVELVKLSPEQENIFKLFLALKSCKLVFGPPGMAKESVQFVQDTLDKMISDEKVLEQMKKVFKVWLKPMKGIEVSKYMESLRGISKESVDSIQGLLKAKYGLGK